VNHLGAGKVPNRHLREMKTRTNIAFQIKFIHSKDLTEFLSLFKGAPRKNVEIFFQIFWDISSQVGIF
jgi:hypothetical protein